MMCERDEYVGVDEGATTALPPSTCFNTPGNKEADDDIAAFYRAKEELDRRKSAAGRGNGVKT